MFHNYIFGRYIPLYFTKPTPFVQITTLYCINNAIGKDKNEIEDDTHFADAFGNFCVFCKNAFEPMQSLPISLNEYFRRENVKKKLQKWKQI